MMINLAYGCKWFKFGFRIYLQTLSGEKMTGISNRCIDGKYVLFIEYDNQDLAEVENEILYLIDFFKLGNSHLIQSSEGNNYHFICPDKFTIKEITEIYSACSGDLKHKLVPYKTRRKHWILRVSEKHGEHPKLIRTFMTNNNKSRAKSTAHFNALKKYYHVFMHDELEDNNTKLWEAEYYV